MKRDITKYPKWVQEYIKDLERKVEAYKERIEILEGRKPTNTRALRIRAGELSESPIGDDVTIRFILENGKIDAGIYNGKEVRIYANSGLTVIPQANNSVVLRVEKW